MGCFIGIDLGTSGVKVIVIDEMGQIISQGHQEQTINSSFSGWAEQDPEHWWQITKSAIREAVCSLGSRKNQIHGIGLSAQMLGAIFLDKNQEVIRPCILWCDQRSIIERDELENLFGLDLLLDSTANYPLTGYWAPKIMWMRRNEPSNFERTDKIIFPKDYIRFRLTGELSTDVSDGGGSSLFNVAKRNWDTDLISKLGLSRSMFVKVYESEAIAGHLSEHVAVELGLSAGIPVIAGAGDQPAGGIGNGIVKEGIISSTIGTSGVIFACTDSVKIDKKARGIHSFCHAVKEKWSIFGCTLSAGGSFKWLRDNLCNEEKRFASTTGIDPYDAMTLLASKVKPGSKGLFFMPYMIGERTPYPDPNASGTFLGLTLRHNRMDIIRSVMEGVTFSLRDSIEILSEFGVSISQVRASGGGGKSDLWRQIQADIFNSEVITTNIDEGPAMGAAILAATGTNAFSSIEEACEAIVRPLSVTNPIADNVKVYQEMYQVYRSIYPALKGIYENQARLPIR